MRRSFCTIFDHRYLTRGLSLYASLKQSGVDFELYVLCFDSAAFELLSRLDWPDIRPVSINDFECGDASLLAAKRQRNRAEYFFTSTGSWLLYLFRNFPHIESLTYCDADLFFFGSPELLDDEIGDHAIVLSPHAFSAPYQHLVAYGIYNAGWLYARRDEVALEALQYWRQRCLEWCFDRLEPTRYADQKYLDDWSTRFQNVGVLSHRGANLAPWNYHDRSIEDRDGTIWVDGQRLVFFHFHGFRQVARWVYEPFFRGYGWPTPVMRRLIFAPYIKTLTDIGHDRSIREKTLPDSSRPRPRTNFPPPRKWLRILRRHIIAVDGYVLY